MTPLNDGYTYRELIDGRAAGQPLDRYLSGRYTHSSHAQWCEHIDAGRVLIDGARVEATAVLRSGQELEWRRAPWREPDAPLTLSVLYDEGGVLVVDKPAGLPTLPGGGFLQHTLLHQLRLVAATASPLHRLGRWTSGAVLCARSPSVAAALTAQFAARSIRKRYRALAAGQPSEDCFEIEAPIGPVPYPPLGTLHAACADGRDARSRVTVIETRPRDFLCDVEIATGRPHQIRIHLAAAGHPLVGDPLYAIGGQPVPGGDALPGDPGYLLHAAELGFTLPETGGDIAVIAPLPEALRAS